MSLKGTEYTGESAVYYDHVATGVDGDVALYVEEARSDGSPILELGCGTGRILIPMAAAGLEVVGLDASHDMLMIARNKLEVLPPEVRRRVQLVEGDMRRFAVDRSNVFDPRVQNLAASTWSMPANRRREFVHPRSGNRVTIK